MTDPKRGIFVAPFGELADPALLAELAQRAEANGWDGFFLWDHVSYHFGPAACDPWIAMAAIAVATERVLIGPLVTPPPRRRIPKLARETVSLDQLSGGRFVFGAGLGSDHSGEFDAPGEEADPKARAQLLDDGLAELQRLWDGGFEPRPVQRPRIPVWLASRGERLKPVRRAARWDGWFPIELDGPDHLARILEDVVRPIRGDAAWDVVISREDDEPFDAWVAAGATWVLRGWGPEPTRAEVERAIDQGP